MKIKIYDKDFNSLTTLFGQNEADFNNLSYTSKLMQVGQASFVLRLDSNKVTDVNLAHFNKLEITDDDDTVRWIGVIVQKEIGLNIVTVRCYDLLFLLNKRLTPSEDSHTGQTKDAVASLINTMNANDDTGISLGVNDITDSIDFTFDRSSIFSALKRIADSTGGQFEINTSRELVFTGTIGTNKSASVSFKYQTSLVVQSNIVNFRVSDDGDRIVSRTYGKSGAFTSDEVNVSIESDYGLLEEFKNFREIDDQTTLDSISQFNNVFEEYSPDLTLLPSVDDNFDVGDTVNVILENKLININDNFQIYEKSVKFRGKQKEIRVRIISSISDFFQQIRRMQSDLNLLNREL